MSGPSEDVPRWLPPPPSRKAPRWEADRGVSGWESGAHVPRWQPPAAEAPGLRLDEEPRPRRAAAGRVSPFMLPFVWWNAHPWVAVWACVFLAPGGVVLLRVADEAGFESFVPPLQWLLLVVFAIVLVRGVLFSAQRSAMRLGLGLVAALGAAALLLGPVTRVTLGRVSCPARAGIDLGVQTAAIALQAWQRGEAGDVAWRRHAPDPGWRDKARTIRLLDYHRVETGCFERVAPIDPHHTWHDFRVTIREGERAPLSKVVVVNTAAEGGGWTITSIEGPLP